MRFVKFFILVVVLLDNFDFGRVIVQATKNNASNNWQQLTVINTSGKDATITIQSSSDPSISYTRTFGQGTTNLPVNQGVINTQTDANGNEAGVLLSIHY